MAFAAAAALLVAPAAAHAATEPAVTIAIVPRDTDPQDLAEISGMSVGVMSAGLSNVSANQTYLDITQGNRVFTSLYEGDNPVVLRFDRLVPVWGSILARAERAPASIEPGLFASTLQELGVPVRADKRLLSAKLIAANQEGVVEGVKSLGCVPERCRGVVVVPATVDQLAGIARRLRGEDLLIAIEKPPPPDRDTLAVGIVGEGYGDGNLTSDNTRTDGFVLATDIAPTILDGYGLEIPEEMSGRPIRAEGDSDAAAVAERAGRMRVVAGRRASVILDNLMIWAGLALLAALLTRGRVAPFAFSLLGLATVYLPLLLLVGAAADTNELAERLIVGLGSPALAALTLRLQRGWGALAIACGLTVGAYATDVIAGSPLTASSLLGPNPGLGVRFFGIGNELEAALAILTLAGVGAGLTAFAERAGRPPGAGAAVAAFLGIGAVAAMIFAAGQFGADVGAAIIFPAGAALAVLAIPGVLRRRRLVLALIAAPLVGLAALASIDLVLGGDAHLSRSVFEAGGADQLADVFERRLRLSASSFNRATGQPLFWFSLLVVLLAIVFRRHLLSWLADAPYARAGLAGATGAMALGIVANDSGALFLIIGSISLLACLAFAWAQAKRQFAAEP